MSGMLTLLPFQAYIPVLRVQLAVSWASLGTNHSALWIWGAAVGSTFRPDSCPGMRLYDYLALIVGLMSIRLCWLSEKIKRHECQSNVSVS